MSKLKIEDLKALGWQPIDSEFIDGRDLNSNVYNLYGELIGKFGGFTSTGSISITNPVFSMGHEIFEDNGMLSFTPPPIEVSLVALGFAFVGSTIHTGNTHKLSLNESFALYLQIGDHNNWGTWLHSSEDRRIELTLPNIKSIPDIKKAIEYLTFLFVER